MDAETERQHHLIQGLLAPQAYPHAVERVRHIETHVSHVLLAGDYAYKIKKPLDLGFLDYRGGLARRHHYCRRSCALTVVPRRISTWTWWGWVVHRRPPRITDEQGEGCLEYAVRMRRFEPGALLSERLQSGKWPEGVTDTLPDGIARFHQAAAVAGPDAPWGAPEQVHGPVQANSGPSPVRSMLPACRRWPGGRTRAIARCVTHSGSAAARGMFASAMATCTWAISSCGRGGRSCSMVSSSTRGCAGSM